MQWGKCYECNLGYHARVDGRCVPDCKENQYQKDTGECENCADTCKHGCTLQPGNCTVPQVDDDGIDPTSAAWCKDGYYRPIANYGQPIAEL
jgi:hypothetical protein